MRGSTRCSVLGKVREVVQSTEFNKKFVSNFLALKERKILAQGKQALASTTLGFVNSINRSKH